MLFVLLLFVPSAIALNYKHGVAGLRMELCHHNTWLNRHYIVYNCNFSNLVDSNEAKRDLMPFACDPTNGIDTKMKRKLLQIGEERKGDDGFIYECHMNFKTGAITYRAKACFVEDERFNPGHYIKAHHNTVFFCYRDMDNVIRLRVRHPVHAVCNSLIDDPRCQQGVSQTIYSSDYGYGEPFAYNPSTGESLTVAIPPPTAVEIVNLSDDRPALSSLDLISAMKGILDPSIKRTTRPPKTKAGEETTTIPLKEENLGPIKV